MFKDSSIPAPEVYDVVIVGGGIVGAGVMRDAALHGLKTLLIDKKDFTSQTSQSSSKMLHGGIRYLETFDFALVWEALHEKNLWLKLAPHLCQEKAFLMPIYRDSLRPLWMLKVGLWLYDFLSSFQNTPHRMLNVQETLKLLPSLKQKDLKGAGLYHDAIVEDAKLTLEVIYDALKEPNAQAWAHHEMVSIEINDQRHKMTIKDCFSGEIKVVECLDVVFATGPFTDQILSKIENLTWRPRLLPSKGSHLWIKAERLAIKSPMVMTPKDGRVIFVIPQRGAVLVGTTEEDVGEKLFDLKVSAQEEQYLLNNLNEYFPELNITKTDILSSFAGIRPLIRSNDSEEKGKTARHHKCYWPKSNVHVIMGGKYTTFRTMAQDIVRNLCQKRFLSYSSERTVRPLRQHSVVEPFIPVLITREHLERILKTEHAKTFEDLVVRRLGIWGKKHWDEKFQSKSFDQFFHDNFDLLEKHLIIKKEEIANFP